MSTTFPGGRDTASRFFDNYQKWLLDCAVPEKQQRWHVRRVEEFIKAQNGRKIKVLPGDVDARQWVVSRSAPHRGWRGSPPPP